MCGGVLEPLLTQGVGIFSPAWLWGPKLYLENSSYTSLSKGLEGRAIS